MGQRQSRGRNQAQQQHGSHNQTAQLNQLGSQSPTTIWKVSLNTSNPQQPSANLKMAINYPGKPGDFKVINLKGLCYSPCPLNGSNKNGSNLGDWFWDSFSGSGWSVTGWEAIWNRDLPNIRYQSPTTTGGNGTASVCANVIRVYSIISRQINTDGTIPSPWNSGHLFTHKNFLDKCWNDGGNPLYVLVGIPLPKVLFWKSLYINAPKQLITFWEQVLTETVTQVGDHPAVLGFVIANEYDSAVVTYPNDSGSNIEDVVFWWSQVEKYASVVKKIAPSKLVGMAVHDDPNIPAKAAQFMAKCKSVDYWGVNSYQPQSFDSIFKGTPGKPGYACLQGPALKPVIFTEYGFPATTRNDPYDPLGIYSDTLTQKAVAETLQVMIPKAFQEPLCLGVYIFEYCDEWWNQDPFTVSEPGKPSKSFKKPNNCTWFGGAPAPGFPNHYWDIEGFGLYSIHRGGSLPPCSPIWVPKPANRPVVPVDVHLPRMPVIQAVQTAFSKY